MIEGTNLMLNQSIDGNKDVVKGALMAIMEKSETGLLRAPDVVDAARETSNPLHGYFEWDDTIAGEKYRLEQARALIRTVRTERYDLYAGKTTVRFFCSLPSDRVQGQGYRLTLNILDDKAQREELRTDILNTIRAWEQKAQRLGLRLDFSSTVEMVNRAMTPTTFVVPTVAGVAAAQPGI